jgi:hypothetical protein
MRQPLENIDRSTGVFASYNNTLDGLPSRVLPRLRNKLTPERRGKKTSTVKVSTNHQRNNYVQSVPIKVEPDGF